METPNAGDLLPVWSTANGSNRALSFSNLALWIRAALSNVIVSGYVRVPAVTVANLPSATVAGVGARAFVTDATSTTFHANPVGGGAQSVPVYSDGTIWRIG
jgi:hypothetical protein